MYKILIVEDDNVIAKAIKKSIESWGYEALVADDFANVLSTFIEFSPQLVLMDISLPYYNGYHWCAEMRRHSSVPIIFISSASDNMNIVMAMNMGGDDFVAKPFDLSVLTAKIQALLRRTYEFSSRQELLQHGGAVLDMGEAMISFSGQKIELSKNEFRILQVLMEAGGQIVNRDTLMQRLWETDSFIDDNTLTVNINRLRKRLSTIGLDDYIVTKKGLGYMVKQREGESFE